MLKKEKLFKVQFLWKSTESGLRRTALLVRLVLDAASVGKYLMCVPGTVLCAGDRAISKTDFRMIPF